jgi:neutral ceramidase
MSNFKAGFARLDITPPLGVNMSGYYSQRKAEGILDNLYASAVAVNDGSSTAVVISLDVIGISKGKMLAYRKAIGEKNSLPFEAVFISCTHTHTGPVMDTKLYEEDPAYSDYLKRKLCDAATIAIADLKPSAVSIGRSTAPGIAFVRRFRMKDGTVKTNPGIGNPDILEPIGTPDESVQLVRIQRENADEILLVNFQVHPDVIGGSKFSADYPKFVRDTLETALDNVKCIYINGAQGDTNHHNVRLTSDQAKTHRGYKHSEHMGKTIAGAVLQAYMKTTSVKSVPVSFGQKEVDVPSNRGDKSKMPDVEKIIALHEEGRDSEIPSTGIKITIPEAYRMKRLENGPDSFELPLTAIRFGDVSLAGIPGEPFTDIGRGIKENSTYEMTLISCCANGYEGYFPMQSAYDEGGYEVVSSSFKPGVAEAIIEGLTGLLAELK